jgi:hypothetical protein
LDPHDQIQALKKILNVGVPFSAISLLMLCFFHRRWQFRPMWVVLGVIAFILITGVSLGYGLHIYDQLPGFYLSDSVWWMTNHH